MVDTSKPSDYVHVCFHVMGDSKEFTREASVYFPIAINQETIVDLHQKIADGIESSELDYRYEQSLSPFKRTPKINIISWQRYEEGKTSIDF